MRVDIVAALNTPKIYVYLDYIGTCAKQVKEYIVGQYESYFHKHEEEHQEEHQRSWSPAPRQWTSSSPSHMSARSTRSATSMSVPWRDGYLEEITVKEGQAVKKGDVMFKILPVLYKARRDAEMAEAKLAQLEFELHREVGRSKQGRLSE